MEWKKQGKRKQGVLRKEGFAFFNNHMLSNLSYSGYTRD
jgi:hypothetical protein